MKQHSLFLCALALLAAAMVSCSDPEEEPRPMPVTSHSDTPRYLAAAAGKIFVSCYNPPSVVRIDTATMQVDAVCPLGDYQPEGIAVAQGKLFISSSWIYNENGSVLYDNRLYVVDLSSFQVSSILGIGCNPDRMVAVGNDYIVVSCIGNYADEAASTYVVDAGTLTVRRSDVALTSFCTDGRHVYAYTSPSYGSTDVTFLCFDPVTLASDTLHLGSDLRNPYGIDVIDGDIYVATATYDATGDIYRFSADGQLRWHSEAGVFTSKTVALGDGTAYILNQGNWGSNNASLGRVNLATGTVDNYVFDQANHRGLGDVAQDIIVYGSRAYVSVTFSNSIEVVDPSDNTSTRLAL